MFKRLFSMSSINKSVIPSSINGPVEQKIIKKLLTLNPESVKVFNDSSKHSHHEGMVGASNVKESHFRIEIVSPDFTGKTLPNRHRMIYNLLEQEINVDKVHALQLKTKTPEEINKK